MRSLFGGGRININRKLKKEVENIEGEIVGLNNMLLLEKPANICYYVEFRLKDAMTKIEKITLKRIERYKKLLESYGYNLQNFPEIHQFENSIKNFYKMLVEFYREAYDPHSTINLDIIIQKIGTELRRIDELWGKHKYNLRRLGIIKKEL